MKEVIVLVNIITPLIALFFCGGMMAWYRINRKFSKDRVTTKLGWFDHSIIEIFLMIMFLALAAPNWGSLLLNKIP